MADPTLDLDLAATAIATSGIYGVRKAAEQLGISIQALKRYRKLMLERPELRARVDERRRVLEAEWAARLPSAIRSAIDFLERAAGARGANPKDPDAIHSVAGALKILSDVAMSKRVLDARLSGQARPARAEDRPGAGETAGGGDDPVETAH